jgi:cellulose synthase (UDP-forming)
LNLSFNASLTLRRVGSHILELRIWNNLFFTLFIALVSGAAMYAAISTPLTLAEQAIFALVAFGITLIIRTLPWGQAGIILMIVVSLMMSLRYMYWRLTTSIDFETVLDTFLGWGLVLAEIYSLIVLILGYIQTAMPLKRNAVMMPTDQTRWPTVDVLIPTYNEDLDVVRLAILAALAMDWPADKIRVYLLDDGRREEFRTFCNEVGAIYLTRDNNLHHKAGNLNAALSQIDGEYVTIFDCDHIPTRSFLQISMGWFLKDPKLAMVQTPHHFFSPDPFEKNLNIYHVVPNEGELFYGLIQDGNDLWNASFFCGSCAVLRRKHLMEVGGIAIETVTEDAHTALKMSRKGYNLAYLAIPQAAGLATESLSRHVVQRIRWARGMAQIFRVDNPLLGRGLTIWQRFCYTNAMLHFFYGLPRLVFLTAPLGFLLLGAEVFSATAIMVVAYALPHIAIASMTNSKIQGRFRHSFWNEVYETALAWYIFLPVALALINPKLGDFNATSKGGIVEKEYVDWNLSKPYIVLLILNVIGFFVGVLKLVFVDVTVSTLLINLAWVSFNIIIISASSNVAREIKQLRASPRVNTKLPATILLPNGKTIVCEVNDFSRNGVDITTAIPISVPVGEHILVSIFRGSKEIALPGTIARCGKSIGVYFENLTVSQQKDFTQITFSRADNWVNVWAKESTDAPLNSLREVLTYGVLNLGPLLRDAGNDLYIAVRAKAKQIRAKA